MRSIVGLYFIIGIALLIIGFFFTGPCQTRNDDLVDNGIFVLTWPVGLYREVFEQGRSAEAWIHNQTCGTGTRGIIQRP